MKSHQLPVIGWREWVTLPDFGIDAIKAKVDTGLRSAAIHAYDIDIHRRGGVDIVRFKVHPLQRNTTRTVEAQARLLDRRPVRSSSGHAALRLVVATTVRVFDQSWPIELTLSNRDEMGFRMLLGRQAIRRRFTVDPGPSYLTGKPPRRKTRRKGSKP